MAFGSAGGAPTALAAWQATPDKHTTGTPPAGAAVYFSGGPAGHSAISAGNGMIYSTDVGQLGKVSLVPISAITKGWGKPLLGWTSQTNEKRISRFDAKPVDGKGGQLEYAPTDSNTEAAGGQVSTELSQKQLREQWGHVASLYEDIPEIQKLVKLGTKEQWTETMFESRVRASKWFRNHTESEREWVKTENTEPAVAKQRLLQAKLDIQNQYRRMGVPIDATRLDRMSRASVVQGWTEQQVTNAIAAEFDYKPANAYGGVAGQTVDSFRQMAAAYLVPLSNQSLDKWTQNVLRGEATPEDFEAYAKSQAKSLFPELSDSIDRGVTVDDYLSPYREMAARTLEVSPEDVDWQSPKWSKAIFQTDEKGGRKVMGLADWQKTLRTDPKYQYDKTGEARDQASTLASNLLKTFGMG